MKEKSHRAPRRCYRSGVWTLRGTQTRRLDGHSLYSAQRPAGPRDFEADHRPVRPAAGQFRRRRPAAEDGRRSARSDLAIGQRHPRASPPRQGGAPAPGSAAAARLRAGLWLPRLQRRRAPGRRPHPQAAARARSARGRALGVATDAVAVRERRGPGRPLSARDGAGRQPAAGQARAAAARPGAPAGPDHRETATLYGETRYAARRWAHKRRIIMKAEVLCYPGRSSKDNPRFLVTNLPHRPATVYRRLYCGRGDMENRLKELQQGLAMDRTSCSRFPANQLRLLFSIAAYVLFQALQSFARTTTLGSAQVWTLRERLLKIAVWVERSVRRIVLHSPQASPWRATWRDLAQALTAT